MKKYIKPVMESENFVANEFIGTCYTISCTNCGGWEEGYNQLQSNVKTESYLGNEVNIYTSTLIGSSKTEEDDKEPCITYTEDTYPGWCDKRWEKWLWDNILSYWFTSQNVTEYHNVTVTPNWTHTTNHPNASV